MPAPRPRPPSATAGPDLRERPDGNAVPPGALDRSRAAGTPSTLPVAWYAYAALSALAAPLIAAADARRMTRANVPADRRRERLGHGAARPAGRLVWLHAVSVGEAMSVLPLAGRLAPHATVLLTTTTPAAAQLVADRLPPGCLHRYAPLDTPGAVGRFLRGWRPDLAVLTESELWPRTILSLSARGVPVALVNARLSDRSLRRWARFRPLAQAMLTRLSPILAQDARTAQGLGRLGAVHAEVAGSLKSHAPPLPADPGVLVDLRAVLGGRPVWVAASTHPGEDEAAAAAQAVLRRDRPDLLLILVPRHADRGPGIARTFGASLRSAGDPPTAATGNGIHVADTMGELGLWYRLSPVAFVGGSLVDRGGHNPQEAEALGCHAVTGPHIANFADTYARMIADGTATMVKGAAALAPAISAALDRETRVPVASPTDDGLLRDAADRLVALLGAPRTPAPWPDPAGLDVIAPNFKRRLSGVTATVVRLVPLQARDIGIAATGPVLPPHVPRIPLWRLPFIARQGPSGARVWHARRNVEMIAGLALRDLLRKRLRLVFTSASQRSHTGLTRWLIARMDAVVATSDRTAAYLERPAAVIRHGIDTDVFAPAPDPAALRDRLGLRGRPPLIGCFGRIRAQKGTDLFVEAMLARFAAGAPGTAIVMGRATRAHAAFDDGLRARVASAGMGSRILFLPEVPTDAMAGWYAALDLYVAPQRHEGFGLTPLEAMACGVPVVATRVGAFEELVRDGATGVLVPPGNADAIADAVGAILDDADRHRAMSAASRSLVAANFTLQGEADALNALYRAVLGIGSL